MYIFHIIFVFTSTTSIRLSTLFLQLQCHFIYPLDLKPYVYYEGNEKHLSTVGAVCLAVPPAAQKMEINSARFNCKRKCPLLLHSHRIGSHSQLYTLSLALPLSLSVTLSLLVNQYENCRYRLGDLI